MASIACATGEEAYSVAMAFRGDTVAVGASSDYGRSFVHFVERHITPTGAAATGAAATTGAPAIDRRTTVVILGDARNNQNDPRVDALAAIKARCARLVWLNPEPEPSWGLGDSEMERYLPFCTFAASVRSLGELRTAVSRLASIVSR